MAASVHLPVRPKTDLVLLYGLAQQVIIRDWVDHEFVKAHTTGFEQFAEHVSQFDLELVCSETGLEEEKVLGLVDKLAPGRRTSIWWTMGVNQSHQGVRTAQAIIDLVLLTGNIGKPGTGACSITGQCNAMGSRLFSNTATMFAGRDFTNEGDRLEVARILGIDVTSIPCRGSWSYDRIIEGIGRQQIRALWVIATNTAHSWINQTDVHSLLDRLDFLAVQDMYGTTETAQRADLVLPAAGWGEKDGTFINSERRIGVVKRVARAPGEALADFAIFKLIAEAWGCGRLFDEWSSPEAAFQILKRLSEGRPCDMSGIDGYRMLDEMAGIQWPYAAGSAGISSRNPPGTPTGIPAGYNSVRSAGASPGWPAEWRRTELWQQQRAEERRLFEDGVFFHGDGRARFVFGDPIPPVEQPDRDHPLVLLTGRGSSAEWHTNTRTAKSAILRRLHASCTRVEIHPDDAAQLGIHPNDHVVVSTRRGSIRVRAVVTPTVQRGQIFIPMHDPATNRLTFPSFDPLSRQPSYKYAAADVRPAAHWEH